MPQTLPELKDSSEQARPSLAQQDHNRCCGCEGLIGFLITFLVLVSSSVIIGYVVTIVVNKRGYPSFSQISELSPQSSIFSQLLNIASVLLLLIVYIKFRHVHYHNVSKEPFLLCANILGLFIGFVSGIGTTVAANFTNRVPAVYQIGNYLAFGGGLVYIWIQLYIAYRLMHTPRGRFNFYLRLNITLLSTVLFLSMITLNYHHQKSLLTLSYHVGHFFVQVTLVVCYLIYLASFTFNFQRMGIVFHVYYVPHEKRHHRRHHRREIKLIFTEMEGADPVVTIGPSVSLPGSPEATVDEKSEMMNDCPSTEHGFTVVKTELEGV